MQVVVNNLLTAYLRVGSGRQILILHGWGDASSSWQPFASELANKNYDVIVPDLPGFGGSDAPAAAWGLDDYAGFLEAFIKKLKLTPSVLVGHSNGGAIALRGLANGNFEVEKLVLLASAGIRGEYAGRNQVLRLAAKTGKQFTRVLPRGAQNKLRKKVYQTIGSDMLVAEHLQETFKKIVSDDVRADAAKVDVPTLLIYGEKDDQAPVRYGRIFYENLPNGTLEILPEADHFLYRNDEAKVLKLVKDFIK